MNELVFNKIAATVRFFLKEVDLLTNSKFEVSDLIEITNIQEKNVVGVCFKQHPQDGEVLGFVHAEEYLNKFDESIEDQYDQLSQFRNFTDIHSLYENAVVEIATYKMVVQVKRVLQNFKEELHKNCMEDLKAVIDAKIIFDPRDVYIESYSKVYPHTMIMGIDFDF